MLHHKNIEKFRKQYHGVFFAIFRILAGLLFAQHGAQKLFGLFTENAPASFGSLMWWAGIIEFAGGLLIAIGLLTTLVSAIGALEMLYAYITAHAPQAAIPIVNRGELALLYLVIFLFIFAHGSGKWSLDSALCKTCKKAA